MNAPERERLRLEVLDKYQILNTPPEQNFDDLTLLAATVCGVRSAAVTFLSGDRQWTKSATGLILQDVPRDLSLCVHALTSKKTLVVPDTLQDARFSSHPLVKSGPAIRFYAGTPIIEKHGHVLGTVCVIDQTAHQMSAQQIDALEALARQVVALLEERSTAIERIDLVRALATTQADTNTLKAQLQLAADVKYLALWTYNPDSDLLSGNEHMRSMFGVNRPVATLSEWIRCLSSRDQQRLMEEFAVALCGSFFSMRLTAILLGAPQELYLRARCVIGFGARPTLAGTCEIGGAS